MKYLIFLIFPYMASAADQIELTELCKEQLKVAALKMETDRIAAEMDTLASPFKVSFSMNYAQKEDKVTVGVHLNEKKEGRDVTYRGTVSNAEALECQIPLKRWDELSCRYSRYGGPKALNRIKGLKFKYVKTLSPESQLTTLEEQQIRAWIGDRGANESVAELIRGTDDGELSVGILKLPKDRFLTYYGGHAGDNPFGMFFIEGTTQTAGHNSDDDVCIN
jgi:hypothetical protein